MDGINNIYNVNSLKFENKKRKKDETVKKTIQTKTGDLSEQMAYLGAINRINIKKPASSDSQKRILSDEKLFNNSDFMKEAGTKIPKVESSEVITLQSGETISVSDYISLIAQQEVGFETEEEYQQYVIQAMAENLESMKQIFQTQNDGDGIIAKGFNGLKELTGLGISSKDIENIITEQEEIINQLTLAMQGQSDFTFEEAYEQYTDTKFSTEKIDNYMRTSNVASAINSACYYDKDYADKLEKTTGKSVNEINQEFALCQNEVLGKSRAAQNFVNKYSASQEGFADKLSSVISTAGLVSIAAGAIVSFIPGGAAIGVPLMTAGKWAAFGGMLTDNAIDLVDRSTDKDGLTGDEVKNLALETGVELVSYAAGRGIGRLTNGLNTMIVNEATRQGVGKVGSYVLGQAAETVSDTALSLTADYAIAQGQSLITTGEMIDWDDYWSADRFLGEGRNQLMGILTGLSSSKVSAYSQGVIAAAQGKIQAGDIDGAKSYLKQSGLGQYASGTKFNNLEASANMPKIMPEVNAKIQSGDIEGAKQILSDNGLSSHTKGKNFTSIERQAHISKAQDMIIAGDEAGAKQYLNDNGLEKYSTGDKFKSVQAQANAPQIIAEAQRMILEGSEKEAQQYLKEQGLPDYAARDNFYQLTIQTKAPQVMSEVEKLILKGDEAGAKQYLKDNGFKEYTNNEKFNTIVENIKTANIQAQAVETAGTMILEGKFEEAKKLLEDSGLEVDDESFKALSDEILVTKTEDEINEDEVKTSQEEVKDNKKTVLASDEQENISFKSSTDSDKEFTSLSNEEFEKLKEKIDEKLEQNPELRKYTNLSEIINKNNILLFDKILTDKRLFNNTDFMKKAGSIIYEIETPEEAQAKCNLIDKILSDERLFNNTDFMKKAGDIVSYTYTPEQAQVKCGMIDKILSDERLFDNPDFMKYTGNIVMSAETPEQAQVKCGMIDKILSDERLFDNPDFMKYAGNIVRSAKTPEQAQIADKILSDERLFDNPDFMKYAGNIVRSAKTPEQAQVKCGMIDKILSDKRLFNNTDFMKKAGSIIYEIETPEQAQIADKILSDERLFDNPDFMIYARDIVSYANTPEQAQIADKILSDERLFDNTDFMKKAGSILSFTKTPEKAQIADKILSDERLFNNPDFMKDAGDIVMSAETLEQAQVKCGMIDKILSDERLFNNTDFMKEAGSIIYKIKTPEKAQIADKILSDERLFDNPDFMIYARDIVSYANTPEKAQIADKILSDERLFNNPDFMKDVGNIIIYEMKTPEKAQIADKILSDERLFNNTDFMIYARDIVSYAKTPEQAQIADKILSDERLFNNPDFMKEAGSILSFTNTPEQAQIADKILSDERLFNNTDFMKEAAIIIYAIKSPEEAQAKCNLIDKILTDKRLFNNTDFMKEAGSIIYAIKSPEEAQIADKILSDETISRLEAQRQKIYNNPDKYVNGEYESVEDMKRKIDEYFNKYGVDFLQLASVYDKEALDNLFRMRFDDVEEYVSTMHKFSFKDLEILSQLSNSTNIDGKPFLPAQKIQFIDLIDGYKKCGLDFSKIETMLAEGKVDTAQLNIDLFNQIMKISGLTDEEIVSIPKEKLTSWDIKYVHLLAKEINSGEDAAFGDLLKAANLEDFENYIHDKSNKYGQANASTRTQYDEMGMDYEKWLHPSKESELHFISKDKNTEQLTQIASQIQEDMNTLMQTPAKGFIKKQFPKFVKGEEFVIPNEYLTSKSKLTKLVKILSDTSEQGQMTRLWKRAQGNLSNADPNRVNNAKNTLTILDHLNQRMDDIDKVQETKAAKTLDLTIKMWDRNPQKDIFQGNYSTCCIGMGGENGSAMPHFVMDTAYNMIELVDNTSGKTIGNALCYFAKDSNGNPIFVVDNIEINNSVKPSGEVGIELRDSITQYASNVAKEVTGQDDVPIYMSKQYNDVPCRDLPESQETIKFMGDIDCEEIYMDLYGGWTDKEDLTDKCRLLRLR